MKLLLIFLTPFLASIVFAQGLPTNHKHDSKLCDALESEAQIALRNMNSAFNTKIQLKFITRSDDHPHSPYYNQPASLLDSNARTKNIIKLAKPCQMPEKTLPSPETYLFVLAHEFAHTVFDDKWEDSCYQGFLSRTYHNDKGEVHHHWNASYDSYHANIDVFALKILSYLSVDQYKAISDAQDYFSKNSTLYGCDKSPCTFNTRLGQASETIPTSFLHGSDFIKSGFISGLPQTKKFIDKHYPNSTFVEDIQRDFPDQTDDCHYPTKKNQMATSAHFFDLLRRDHRDFSLRNKTNIPATSTD